MIKALHPPALWLLLAAGIAAQGCSGSGDDLPREAVSGTVTLDDRPLAEGTIQFNPRPGPDGSAPAVGGGSPVEDGRFSIPRASGLVPGTYSVSINAATQGGAPKTKGRLVKGAGLAKESIPAKYNARTELTAEVKKGGSSDLEFKLKSN